MEKQYRWLSTQRPAPFAWQTQDLHPSGAVGNATLASPEKGERLLDHGARGFIELLDDVDKFDVKGFRAKSGKIAGIPASALILLNNSTLPKIHATSDEPDRWSLRPIGTCGPQRTALNRMEFSMSIKTKIAALAVAALAVAGSIASTTTTAEAHGFHHGWGFGGALLGAAIVGSAIAATTPAPPTVIAPAWVRQYDAFGRYIGTVNTCY